MEALQKAKELTAQLLKITRNFSFTSETDMKEDDMEAYIIMLDEREVLIDEIADLRLQMDDYVISSPEFAEISKIISEISEINKKHVAIMNHLRKNAQDSYKEIKQGQRIHAGYNPLPGDEVSSRINVKH